MRKRAIGLAWFMTACALCGDAPTVLAQAVKGAAKAAVPRRVAEPSRPTGVRLVEIGFAAEKIAVSPDGRRAAVWRSAQHHNSPPPGTESRIALIDLDAGRVLAARALPSMVSDAAVDGDTVYVASTIPDLVETYRLDQQTLVSTHRALSGGSIRQLEVLSREALALLDDDPRLHVLGLPDLKPIRHPSDEQGRPPSVSLIASGEDLADQVVYRLREGWVAAGRLLDPDDWSTRLILGPGSMPVLPLPDLNLGMVSAGHIPLGYPLPWERFVDGAGPIQTRTGKALGPGHDLLLMSRMDNVGDIPTEGREQVIVADARGVLYFRIFANDGQMAVNIDGRQLPEKKSEIAELKSLLGSLWDQAAISPGDRTKVIAAVRSIVGHPLGLTESSPGIEVLGMAFAVMGDQPIGLRFSIFRTPPVDDKGVLERTELALLDLVEGKVVETVTLAEPELVASGGGWGSPNYIETRGRRVVCVRSDRLYALDLSDEQLTRFKPPYWIVPKQEALIVSAKGSTSLPTRTEGEGERTFALVGAIEGLSIDEETGTVTADGPTLARTAVTYLLRDGVLIPFLDNWPADGSTPSLEPAIDPIIEKLTPSFERLTGRKPEGVPVAVPVKLVAMGADRQLAWLAYYVLVEVPRETLLGRIREQEERVAAQGSLDTRVRALEKRLESLESRLLQLLEEMPAERPR